MGLAKYMKESYERIEEGLERSADRARPVAVRKHRDPVNELARLVLSYEPKDLRLDMDYMTSHVVLDTSSVWSKDVVEGAKITEVSRVPGEGRLIVAVDAHSNMAEFERYNSVVRDHNQRWEDEGCPSDSFDPWSGDISSVEGYVDPASADDSAPKMGDHRGRLFRARPNAKRSRLVTVEYRVIADSGTWKLEFVACDRNGKVVCWDTFCGTNLAALVRRSVQMLYGNHEVQGNEGPFSEGLPMLVNGRKVGHCRRMCLRPGWSGGSTKDFNPGLAVAKVEEGTLHVSHGVFGYVFPVLCVIAMLLAPLFFIVWQPEFSGHEGPIHGFWPFVAVECGLAVAAWLFTMVSVRAKRGAEASHMRQSFL